MEPTEQEVSALKALCDPTRLRILGMLEQTGEMSACAILRAFECTQPTISYHMRLLVESGLVHARKEGCQTLYTVNEAIWRTVQALLRALRDQGVEA